MDAHRQALAAAPGSERRVGRRSASNAVSGLRSLPYTNGGKSVSVRSSCLREPGVLPWAWRRVLDTACFWSTTSMLATHSGPTKRPSAGPPVRSTKATSRPSISIGLMASTCWPPGTVSALFNRWEASSVRGRQKSFPASLSSNPRDKAPGRLGRERRMATPREPR